MPLGAPVELLGVGLEFLGEEGRMIVLVGSFSGTEGLDEPDLPLEPDEPLEERPPLWQW